MITSEALLDKEHQYTLWEEPVTEVKRTDISPKELKAARDEEVKMIESFEDYEE